MAVSGCALHKRQKLRLAFDAGQVGSRNLYFARLHQRAILISISRCRISGLAFTVNLRKRRFDQVGNSDFPVLLGFRTGGPQPNPDLLLYRWYLKVLEMPGTGLGKS
jgi:hypothetical protein